MFLGHSAKPHKSDLLTPISQGRTREDIIPPFYEELIKRIPRNSELHNLESDAMGGSGSFSLRDVGWWRTGVDAFKGDKTVSFPSTGFDILTRKLAQYRTSPLPVVPQPHWNTNAGYPYFKKGERVVDDVLGDIGNILSSADFRNEAVNWPFLLGWRGQPKAFPDVTKSRVVWMEAKSWAAVTSMFTYPIIQSLKRCPMFVQLAGPDSVDLEITNALAVKRADSHRYVSGDKSAFDASISRSILYGAIEVVRSLLILTPSQEVLFDACFSRMVDKSLLTPDGLITVTRGVPSGHGATNLIDSLITLALIYELAVMYGALLAAMMTFLTCLTISPWRLSASSIPPME